MKSMKSNILTAGWAMAFALSAWAGSPVVADQGKTVYESDFGSDFAKVPTENWSSNRVAKEAERDNWYLGEFGPTTVTFTLDDLPKHRFLRINFDLILLNYWGGSNTNQGPDRIIVRVKDGPVLMDSTFSNHPSMHQSFPDRSMTAFHAGLTGSDPAERNRSGLYGRYAMSFYVPHDKESLVLEFEADFGKKNRAAIRINGQARTEKWALNHVVVTAFEDEPLTHTDEQVRELLVSLASSDAVHVRDAAQQLIAGGDHSVSVMRSMAPFVKQSDLDEKVRILVESLNSDNASIREQAVVGLQELGVDVVPLLERQIDQRMSLSQWAGIYEALYDLRSPSSYLLLERLANILEIIGTEDALQLREMLPQSARTPMQRVQVIEQRGLLGALHHMRQNNQRLSMIFTFRDAEGKALANESFLLRWRGGEQMVDTDESGTLKIQITEDITEDAVLEVARDVQVQSRAHVDVVQRKLHDGKHQLDIAPMQKEGIILRR